VKTRVKEAAMQALAGAVSGAARAILPPLEEVATDESSEPVE